MKLSAQEFERLALEQIDTVYRIAVRLARDPVQADDLVQETYLRALKARDSFDLQEFGIRPWLLRILHNLYLSQRHRDGWQPAPLPEEHLDWPDPTVADSLPIDPQSLEAMDQRLVRAINSLSDDYRLVLLYWAVEDMSYKEIADALGVPIGTVMSRLHRVRQRLGDELRGFALERRIIRE